MSPPFYSLPCPSVLTININAGGREQGEIFGTVFAASGPGQAWALKKWDVRPSYPNWKRIAIILFQSPKNDFAILGLFSVKTKDFGGQVG